MCMRLGERVVMQAAEHGCNKWVSLPGSFAGVAWASRGSSNAQPLRPPGIRLLAGAEVVDAIADGRCSESQRMHCCIAVLLLLIL